VSIDYELEQRLARIEHLLDALVEQQKVKDYYAVDEFAQLVGKSQFTVREWARLGRINAVKRKSGRGAYHAWVVSNEELLRYRREGLLPESRM
jgi:hypothetical protein